jgi:hypothetical protein
MSSCYGSCERYALSPVAAASRWWMLPLPVTVAVSRVPGNGWAGVTILCAWCENPIPAGALRDAVRCSVCRCGGFKLGKRGRKGAAQLRLCAVDRG